MANYSEKIKELMRDLSATLTGSNDYKADGPLSPSDFNFGHLDSYDNDNIDGAAASNVQIDIDKTSKDIVSYWNESVQALIDKHKNAIIGLSEGQDAGYSFIDSPYVNPNINKDNETYDSVRTDEIIDVLKNKENLDYTIRELTSYATRLLMPQYERRVEIEDLNRNFWVIGQNLTLLNESNSLLESVISEIVDLWENTYRIWQCILYFAGALDGIETEISQLSAQAAKVRVQLAYGQIFGAVPNAYIEPAVIDRLYKKEGDEFILNNGKLQLTETFLFKKGDEKYFGLIPLLEKEEILYHDRDMSINKGWVLTLPYNKGLLKSILDSLTEKELEDKFINNPLGLIKIDRKFGNRSIKDILSEVKARNYCLVTTLLKNESSLIDNLTILKAPYLSFLQFFRDILLHEEFEDSLEEILTAAESSLEITGVRATYLPSLNFTTKRNWNLTDAIPYNIIETIKYIQTTRPEIFNNTIFAAFDAEEVLAKATVEDFILYLKSFENKFYGDLLSEFYNIYKNLYLSFGGQLTEEDEEIFPYFFEDKLSWVITENISGLTKFKNLVTEYNKVNSIDEVGTVVYCPTKYLFASNKGYFDDNNLINYITINDNKYKIFISEDDLNSIPQHIFHFKWDLICNELLNATFGKNKFKVYTDNGYIPSMNANVDNPADRLKYQAIQVLPKCGYFEEEAIDAFSNSYLSPWKPGYGILFDFVHEPTGNGVRILNGEIQSFTSNLHHDPDVFPRTYGIDILGGARKWHNTYNIDIQTRFSNVANQKYQDFVRYCKPYPSLSCLLHDRAVNGESNHINALNNPEYYLSYSSPLKDIYVENEGWTYQDYIQIIDGFIGFDTLISYPIGVQNPSIPNIDYDVEVKPTLKGELGRKYELIINKQRRFNDDEIFYFGPVYSSAKQYTLSSTDLVNSNYPNTDNEGKTLWNNHNEINNPSILISYLSSDADSQQLSLSTSKDTTNNNWKRTLNPTITLNSANAYTVRIGDFYPEDVTFENLTKINDGVSIYDKETYGINAYCCLESNSIEAAAEEYTKGIRFISYVNEENEEIKMSELTPLRMEEIGKKVIAQNIGTEILPPAIAFTKMGVNFWKGVNGSQWSRGQVCHLFYIDSNREIHTLAYLNRIDGYWDGPQTEVGDCFSLDKNQSKWRHLIISAHELYEKNTDGRKIIYGSGRINWADKNIKGTAKEVGNDPYCIQRGLTTEKNGVQERIVAYCNFYVDEDGSFKTWNKDNTFEQQSEFNEKYRPVKGTNPTDKLIYTKDLIFNEYIFSSEDYSIFNTNYSFEI